MYKRRKDIKNGMSKDKIINLVRILKGFAFGKMELIISRISRISVQYNYFIF